MRQNSNKVKVTEWQTSDLWGYLCPNTEVPSDMWFRWCYEHMHSHHTNKCPAL